MAVAAGQLAGRGARWLDRPQPAPQDEKKDPKTTDKSEAKEAPQLTPAAERTRTKSLKAKVTVSFTEKRLGDVLKEFAAQVDMNADAQLMWTSDRISRSQRT